MHRAVARDQLGALRPRQLAEGVLQCLGGKLRVEPRQRIAQSLRQHHLAVVVALGGGLPGGDLGAVPDQPGDAFQPAKSDFFDH